MKHGSEQALHQITFENLTTTITNPTTFYSLTIKNFVPEIYSVLEIITENIGSTNIVLTVDELARIDTTVNGITLVGDRYPDFLEKQIDK